MADTLLRRAAQRQRRLIHVDVRAADPDPDRVRLAVLELPRRQVGEAVDDAQRVPHEGAGILRLATCIGMHIQYRQTVPIGQRRWVRKVPPT